MAVALIGAVVTCVDQPTPPFLPDPGLADSQAAAVQAAPVISHTLLTSGHNPVNQKVYTTEAITPAPNALILATNGNGVPSVGRILRLQ